MCNIWNVWNDVLESTLRGMCQANMDVGVFQETKLTDGIYKHGSDGYRVVTTLMPSRNRRGVALFYHEPPIFSVETIHQFGANIIACQLAMWERHWYIVGYYLALGDGATIQDVETAMNERQRGTELIVAGDLNADLERTAGQGLDKEIEVVVVTAGIKDISWQFILRQHTW